MALTVTAAQAGAGGTWNGIVLTVKVLTGQAASPVGATASSGTVTTPDLAITPSASGSWVYGAVASFNGSSGFTASAATTFSKNTGDAVNGGSYGTFRSTSTTTSGSPVTLGGTAPTGTSGFTGIALLEILAGTGLAEDASSPAAVSSTSATTVTTASFTPPAGSLLVAMVASNGSGTAPMTMGVSDSSGLTWTQRSAGSPVVAGGSETVASVWTARVPGVVSGTASLAAESALTAGATSSGVTVSGTAALTAASTLTAGGALTRANQFPYHPLGAKVELLLNGAWTDITAYVRLSDGISISPFGRTNETSGMQAGQASLTLNNTTGRFSPGNSLGAYYPYVQLNTQLRISVTDVSATGVPYTGYRFWGEVSSWPATWDESARNSYVTVTVTGIWQRLSASTRTIGSPYTRWQQQQGWTIAGYWPMEDGSGSTSFATLAPSTSANMIVVTGTPSLGACGNFRGSDALPGLNQAELSGSITTAASPSAILFRFCLFPPTNGDGTASGTVARMHLGGTIDHVDVVLAAGSTGPTQIQGFNSSGTQLFSGSTSVRMWGQPLLVEVRLTHSGTTITWAMNMVEQLGSGFYSTTTGTLSGSLSDATSVIFNPGKNFAGTAVGQAIVLYGTTAALTGAIDPLGGWQNEFAGARFLRICTEEGIPAVLTGSSTSGTAMGPQTDDTLPKVLQQIEDTDGGFLYETQDRFGLGYRTLASLQDQSAAATLDYSKQQLFAPLSPVTDATLTRNDVTLTNYDGYALRMYLASGARSIQAPPSGVGTGYEYTRSVNVSFSSHAQVEALAQQILNSGTVSDPRYPTVAVNLARTTTASLFSAIPSLKQGDYLALSNMPAFGGATSQKQLVWGWTETIGDRVWTIAFNTIPEAPFESGYAPGTSVSGQVPGSPVSAAQAGSVSGAQIAENAISLFQLSQEVLTYTFGGITSTISTTAPENPGDGYLWFDASNGYQIKRWDATAGSWVPVTFDGANILGAGTITAGLIAADAVVAGNIAADAVTATQIAAGAVTSGAIAASVSLTSPVITGGTITGGSIVADGSRGEVLVYSGLPGSGNLLVAISGATGTDSDGNAYSTGMTLAGLSSTPTAISGSAILYGTSDGSLQTVDGLDGNTYQTQHLTRYLANSGANVSIGATSTTVFNIPIGARSYRIHAWCLLSASGGGTCVPGINLAGPGTINGGISAHLLRATAFQMSNFLWNSPTGMGLTLTSGQTWVCLIEGVAINTVAGSISLQFFIQSGTSALTVVNPSFIDLYPI